MLEQDANPFTVTYMNFALMPLIGHWTTVPAISGVGLGQMVIAAVIADGIQTRNASLAILSDLKADLAYMANFGYFLSVDLVVTNQLDSPAPVYISLQFERNMGFWDGPKQKLSTTSISVTLSKGLYSTSISKIRLVAEIIFMAMNIAYLVHELNTAFLAYQQFRGMKGILRLASFACISHLNSSFM